MRIAFLTNEFVTEKNSRGLGSYLDRITRTLREMGHEPEVFVRRADSGPPGVSDLHGVRVERVPVSTNLPLRAMACLERRFLRSPWGGPSDYLGTALDLGRALDRRHRDAPFDLVQSTNCGASGLFVRTIPGRRHVIRLSSHLGLWWRTDGRREPGARLMVALERACVRRAEIAYAPSRYLADYCRESGWRDDVRVVRPPIFVETEVGLEAPPGIPDRYLLHFGQIGVRKGSDVVARALVHAWREAPELKMIWAGTEILRGDFDRLRMQWGASTGNVTWLGMLPKQQVYALLKGAAAAVLPSRVDNFPNTVIESLMLGIPVIGSAGASIDELVEPGRNGELIPIGDDRGLAEAMLRAWRGGARWFGEEFHAPAVLATSSPQRAARELLQLAGHE